MGRLFLAVLLTFAFLANPLAASAAQASCPMADQMAAMTTAAGHAQDGVPADPCCDPSKACAQLCALAATPAVVVEPPLLTASLTSTAVVLEAAQAGDVRSPDARGLDPPPKRTA